MTAVWESATETSASTVGRTRARLEQLLAKGDTRAAVEAAVVTSRSASPEELAALGDIRRRSPFAPWKLLVRAIDAFHRNDDDRVATNVAAIDTRSPAARAGDVLAEWAGGRPKGQRSFVVERLVDRIGGRATIAAQIRNIDAASKSDDRRRVREELRALARSFDTLSPYALEQLRLALLPIAGAWPARCSSTISAAARSTSRSCASTTTSPRCWPRMATTTSAAMTSTASWSIRSWRACRVT